MSDSEDKREKGDKEIEDVEDGEAAVIEDVLILQQVEEEQLCDSEKPKTKKKVESEDSDVDGDQKMREPLKTEPRRVKNVDSLVQDMLAQRTHTKTSVQFKSIKSKIEDIVPFKHLEKEDLNIAINAMYPKTVEKGEVIVFQGDYVDYFYLIDRGSFTISKKDEEGKNRIYFKDIDSGYFGLKGLLNNVGYKGTIKAQSTGLLWTLTRNQFEIFVFDKLLEKRNRYIPFLNKVELFHVLTEQEKIKIVDMLKEESYDENEVIYKKGDIATKMWIIISGNIKLRRRFKEREKTKEDVLGA